MKILVCNAGSTSLKFKLFEMPSETVLAVGKMERVGSRQGGLFEYKNINGGNFSDEQAVIPTYETGIRRFLEVLCSDELGVISSVAQIDSVGFKTVLSKGHYGTHIIDEAVLKGMEDYLTVAPAHNKHYLEAIRTFQKILPNTRMVGAFETAFHQTMLPEAYIYSVPYEWYEKYGIRRLGYHGASHSYIADCLREIMGERYRAVSCHLGGSGSLCAIVDGKSVDTSFGFSLQVGLPQMSRSGDIDPYIINYLVQSEGMTVHDVFSELQTKGGMLGISGVSNDLRDIEKAAPENERAQLALDIYCREIIRYIGGYAAIMGGLDCIAFTGGVGENSSYIRDKVLSSFAFLGLEREDRDLGKGVYELTKSTSRPRAFVIPANEELGIARKIFAL